MGRPKAAGESSVRRKTTTAATSTSGAASKSGGSFLKVERSGKSMNNLQKMSTRASRRLRSSSRSGSRRRKKKEDAARVYDSKGNDVTPKPLAQISQRIGSVIQNNFEKDGFSASASFGEVGGNLGARTRSGMSSQSGSDVDMMDNASERDFDEGQDAAEVEQGQASTSAEVEEEARAATPAEKLSEADLQEMIVVKLFETETKMLLVLPSKRVWNEDTENDKLVEAKNKAYLELLERRKTEADKYTSSHAQTFNRTTRNKDVQVTPAQTTNTASQAYTFDIYDAAVEEENNEEEAGEGDIMGTKEENKANDDKEKQDANDQLLAPKTELELLFSNEDFAKAVTVLEQAVTQNEIHEQQLLYRNHPNQPKDSEEKLGIVPKLVEAMKESKSAPHLVKLWTYGCPLVEDINVSCMCFNKQNPDMLCVGYGGFQFGNTQEGTILFWSLKNPAYPIKKIKTKSSVISIDFCTEHPHLLAAGFYNGSVAIYDIRYDSDKPALESAHATGKHSDPVWGIKWVTKEANKPGQSLVSISSDGTVLQWSMKKGLVPDELMQLKRIPNIAQFQGSHMEGISREASGLCFDFPIGDGTQYFAGTEDGLIHKCSVSYNEQTLENYYCHTGPVYKVRTSPFLADAFLSCSADWTCALWSETSQKPLLTFQSGFDYVTDICWSPSNSCMFACVSRDSRVEIWDLESSPLDPVVQHKTNKELTCVLFTQNSPVVVTGATDGSIDVYRVCCVAESTEEDPWTRERQAARLNEAMYIHNETKDGSASNKEGSVQKEGEATTES